MSEKDELIKHIKIALQYTEENRTCFNCINSIEKEYSDRDFYHTCRCLGSHEFEFIVNPSATCNKFFPKAKEAK